MEAYINEYDKPCYKGVTTDSEFNDTLFHKPKWQPDDGENFALHTNLGSLTVCDRMTGSGWRDVESGYRDNEDNFWLASGDQDVRISGCKTIGEAIQWVKDRANTCIPSTGEAG